MVDSHIQMPKLVMKNFTNSNSELFYFDFERNLVQKGHPKSLYTEYGYYSDYVEDFLSTEVESRLGVLLKYLKNASFDKDCNPPKNYEETSFIYIYYLLARSPSFLREICNIELFQLFDDIDKHDIAARDGLLMANKNKLLKGYEVAFFDNISDEVLVLPTSGIIQLRDKLLCPISPCRAIVYVKKKEKIEDKNDANLEIKLIETDDVDSIHQINIQAFKQEDKNDRKYVVSNNKELLSGIKCELNM